MPEEKKTTAERRRERFQYLRQYRNDHYARIEINIPPELRDKIYERAAEEGISRTQLIVKALTEYMEKDGEGEQAAALEELSQVVFAIESI